MKSKRINDPQEKGKGKIRKLPRQLSDPNLKKKILEHWQNVPAILEIEGLPPIKFIHQEVRSEILDILREGIEEYDDSVDRSIIRHVFSSKELHKLIKERLATKIKVSNVYFHLHKLEENGFVEIIASIKEGRHVTHYFGRTARLFLWIGEPIEELKENSKFKNIVSVLKHFNPDLPSDSIDLLLTSLVESKKETHTLIKNWIEVNEDLIIKLNLDVRDLYTFLVMINRSDPSTSELHKKIADMLNFPLN